MTTKVCIGLENYGVCAKKAQKSGQGPKCRYTIYVSVHKNIKAIGEFSNLYSINSKFLNNMYLRLKGSHNSKPVNIIAKHTITDFLEIIHCPLYGVL
jgi:hypothetical protein